MICAENPCNYGDGLIICPKDFYLCESQCKPNFISCNKACDNNGFYCERQVENITVPLTQTVNITVTAFQALDHKRVVNLRDIFWKYDSDMKEYFDNLRYMNFICEKIYQDKIKDEKCCLPLNYRCDGTIECWNGEQSVIT